MTERKLLWVALLTVALVACALLVAALVSLRAHQTPHALHIGNPLRGRPNMVDGLQMIDNEHAFRLAELDHVKVIPGSASGVVLSDDRTKSFPRDGIWTSQEFSFGYDLTEFIPSWNVIAPPETGVSFRISTKDAGSGQWSPWLYIGQWGRTSLNDPRPREFEHGAVHVDNLVLDRPASSFKIQAELFSFSLDNAVNPIIRRVAIVASGQVNDPEQFAKLNRPVKIEGDWRRDLGVPFRPQGDGYKSYAGVICSPTSTSMVLQYYGVNRTTDENALAIYDPENDMFGNWGRNIARAGDLGMDAWIDRFRDWNKVKACIAAGQPLIANIRFEAGEFPSNVQKATNGHLIVIRGFTKDGDVIVNDPASREKGNGVIYKANELAKAWFENSGGVGYVIHPATHDSTAQAR